MGRETIVHKDCSVLFVQRNKNGLFRGLCQISCFALSIVGTRFDPRFIFRCRGLYSVCSCFDWALYKQDLIIYLFLGVRSDPELRGVIPNSFDHIFTHISRTHDQQYLVRASYLEIYQVRSSWVYFHIFFFLIVQNNLHADKCKENTQSALPC